MTENFVLMKKWLVFILIATIFMVSLYAHITSSEQLHTVAAAYRRATFVLNLRPVVWQQVWTQADDINAHMKKFNISYYKSLQKEITIVRNTIDPIIAKNQVLEIAIREKNKKIVFNALTRAIAHSVLFHLQQVSNHQQYDFHLAQAQQIFTAFADILPHSDPQGWKQLNKHWQGLKFEKTTEEHISPIRSYVKNNYLNFTASSKKLIPYPVNSPTYQAVQTSLQLPPGSNINKQVPRPRQILGMAARGVSESETPLIALGDMAFDSTYIFGEPARSLQINCNTCHNKGVTNPNFFIPGLSKRPGGLDVSNSHFASHANDGVFNHIDIPDLRGIRFTAPYGRNGRFSSLREFVRNVIVNEFNGPEPDPMVLDGMIQYMNEFEFLPNPKLNKDGTLSDKTNNSERHGEQIFHRKFPQMAGKSCASCHIPSSHFIDHKRHNIGTVKGFTPHSLDGALDTPTLLSAKYTAPYFHNGSLATLNDVVKWFNRKFSLQLTATEIKDLTQYLEAVGDGVEAYETSKFHLDAELEEFSFFLSAYEFLRQRNKNNLIGITFQTIASEIRNHRGQLRNTKYLPVMDKMAQLIDEAYQLNLEQKYELVDKKVAEYRQLYHKNADYLK